MQYRAPLKTHLCKFLLFLQLNCFREYLKGVMYSEKVLNGICILHGDGRSSVCDVPWNCGMKNQLAFMFIQEAWRLMQLGCTFEDVTLQAFFCCFIFAAKWLS